LPVLGEIVFRGIVLQTLIGRVWQPAAILISMAVFLFIWPLFGIAFKIFLGGATGLLYVWRKDLSAPVFASIVATVSCGFYVCLKIWS